MTLRNLSPLFALVTGLVIISCSPYPEEQPKPTPPADPAQNKTLTAEEQQKVKEEREKAAAEAQRKQEEEQKNAEAGGTTTGGTGEAGGGTKPPGERKDWPFASPVPGKTGFVFSPYNNKVIDVRDIPSGMLVQDPTYPAAEKKYFRVP